MSATEIILLLLGIIIFIASFVIPEKRGELNAEDKKLSEKTMKEILSQEMDGTKSQIQDIADETISHSIENTERTMDRLTNEKMLAVNEYSDTVLTEINKNHKEVIFLYNMLNDKQETLKDTLQLVQKTTKEAETAIINAKEIAKEARKSEKQAELTKVAGALAEKPAAIKTVPMKTVPTPKKDSAVKTIPVLVGGESGKNNNDKILKLHKAGKSKMSIAKELGLGLGEVKLVIDLFEGM